MKPTMSEAEIEFFTSNLNSSSHYLETGCGGTTLLAIEAGVKQIDIVETDIDWIRKLKVHPAILQAMSEQRIRFHHRNIGRVKQWGFPSDDTYRHVWPFYSLGVWTEIEDDVDLVLVDGRFRVATALASLLMARKDTTIILHDFAGRDYYNVLLDYVILIEQIDTMIVFKRDKASKDKEILLAWFEYMYDPR